MFKKTETAHQISTKEGVFIYYLWALSEEDALFPEFL